MRFDDRHGREIISIAVAGDGLCLTHRSPWTRFTGLCASPARRNPSKAAGESLRRKAGTFPVRYETSSATGSAATGPGTSLSAMGCFLSAPELVQASDEELSGRMLSRSSRRLVRAPQARAHGRDSCGGLLVRGHFCVILSVIGYVCMCICSHTCRNAHGHLVCLTSPLY